MRIFFKLSGSEIICHFIKKVTPYTVFSLPKNMAIISKTDSIIKVTPVNIQRIVVDVNGFIKITAAHIRESTALMAGKNHLLFFGIEC